MFSGKFALFWYSFELSLYEPIGTDKEGNEISLLDIIESPPVDIVEEYSTRQDIRFLFSSMKDILTPKEYQVICCRYGLFENNEMTQREIADQLHISRSYVSRIEKNALKKLKTLFGWFSVRNTLKLETDWDVFSRKEVFYSYDRYNWTIRLCIYAQTIETTADSSALYCFDRNRFCTRFGLCSLTACNDQQL